MNGDCRKNETFMTHCVKDRLSSMDDNFIPIMSSIDDEISIFPTVSQVNLNVLHSPCTIF